jgi:hypothetical protein
MDIDPRPAGYPRTANSGIADARAFRIGASRLVHRPARFPDANKVVAACGAYGWAVERDARIASWANSLITCTRCGADPAPAPIPARPICLDCGEPCELADEEDPDLGYCHAEDANDDGRHTANVVTRIPWSPRSNGAASVLA